MFSISVFLAYFIYFSFTGYYLPKGAGPDYPVSRAAVTFYLEHSRLAVYPDDKELMTFTKFGNTRVMRPPLAFATSAFLAKYSPWLERDWRLAYRHGSALFCALAVLCVFIGFLIYFNRYWIAFLGSALLGLMPQFTFTASYLNDDSSAFFAASILFLSMILIAKRGISSVNLLWFGVAVGLVVISKQTAWILLPSAVLFYLIYIFRFNVHFFKQHLFLFGAFIVGGGWWCIWNMLHYGLSDPFLLKLTGQIISENVRVNLSQLGFKAQGLGFYDLILYNAKGFLGVTYRATIGYLDWLKLLVSDVQYRFYFIFLVLAALYAVLRVLGFLVSSFKGDALSHLRVRLKPEWQPDIKLEALILMMIGLQVLVYTWHNIHNDIQIQGKYIIPIVFPMLLLSLSSVYRALSFFERWPKANRLLIACLVVSPMLVHFHAVRYIVIPYYWPTLFAN